MAFAPDFPPLLDHEWGFRLGGFGGVHRGAPLRHVPVIFVHGNTTDAADWYPVREDFRNAGWTDQELWALSYNGLGSNAGTALHTPNPARDTEHAEMDWDGQARLTNNEVNVPDLFEFIEAVRTYTGSPQFALVAHSLGVTLARRTLKVHPELRAGLVAFVAIAGANHGTSFCPPGSETIVVSCDEIAAGTEWLADLNGPGGTDETYPPARWMTIYDGSGVGDPAFAGPTYAESPSLSGADNRRFPGTYHNDLRLDPAIVAVYRTFVEGVGPHAPTRPPPSPDPSDAGPDRVAPGAPTPASQGALSNTPTLAVHSLPTALPAAVSGTPSRHMTSFASGTAAGPTLTAGRGQRNGSGPVALTWLTALAVALGAVGLTAVGLRSRKRDA